MLIIFINQDAIFYLIVIASKTDLNCKERPIRLNRNEISGIDAVARPCWIDDIVGINFGYIENRGNIIDGDVD